MICQYEPLIDMSLSQTTLTLASFPRQQIENEKATQHSHLSSAIPKSRNTSGTENLQLDKIENKVVAKLIDFIERTLTVKECKTLIQLMQNLMDSEEIL